MKVKLWILRIALVLLFSSMQAFGQTPDNLEAKYGKAFNAFEIRPGVMLRIQKGDQGKITEMRVESFSGAEASVHLNQAMDAYLVKEVIDEIVPVEERGSQGQHFGLTLFMGAAWSASYDYEFVSIDLLGSIDLKRELSPKRYRRDNPFQSAEVIIIKWKNR